MKTKIAFFASGSGSNIENIIDYFGQYHKTLFEFSVIVTNKKDAFVHHRAQRLGVPSYTFSREEFAESGKIIEILKEYQIDAIVLAGFLLRVSPKIIEAFPQQIINIHPALLPKYGGKGMYGSNVHRAVKAANEQESGITIHYVNEQYDDGNIIFQAKCQLNGADTPESIAEKVHQLEYRHFPRVIAETFGGYSQKGLSHF